MPPPSIEANPPMPPRMPLGPMRPIFFITSDICRCILRSLLTSETCTPAPDAMRLRREPLMMSGLTRSVFVIDEMIAS